MRLKYFVVSPSPIFRFRNTAYDGNPSFRDMFKRMCPDSYEETRELKEADIVIWTGGADVSPYLYGRRVHHRTNFNVERDLKDMLSWHFSGRAKLRLGICRGAQFLNVMNGGDLFQHIEASNVRNSHTNLHKVFRYEYENILDPDNPGTTKDVHEYLVSSTHHQMMKPSKDGLILSHAVKDDYSSHSLCSVKHHGASLGQHRGPERVYPPKEGAWFEEDVDPETVFYPKTRSLCVQGHPEFDSGHLDDFRKDLHRMIQEIITKCAA